MCGRFKPHVVFLMETKIKSGRLERVRRRSFDFTGHVYVDPVGIGGGLAIWWRSEVDLQILKVSKNVIHAVMNAGFLEKPCFVTFVYGPPSNQGREEFWDMMMSLNLGNGESWVCFGDFNDFLYHSEKQGGNVRSENSFVRFRGWMFDCDMLDMEYKGCCFTWTNGQKEDGFVRERLDRAVCNVSFRNEFPIATVIHVEMLRSDHSLLVVDLFHKDSRRKKRFRFESYWVKHEEFNDVVRDGWCDGNVEEMDCPIADVGVRLRQCESVLSKWGAKRFPNCRKKIAELKRKITSLKMGDWSVQKAEDVSNLSREIEELWKIEEEFRGQRARLSWVQYGDKNSKFFHTVTVQRRQRNRITKIKDSEGVWVDDERQIADDFRVFFSDLFTSVGDRDFQEALEVVLPVIDDAENVELLNLVTYDEIRKAVFQLGKDKAPGPDGFSGVFFKALGILLRIKLWKW